DKSHISRIQLLSLWCHSTSLPGVFVKTFLFQIDMIRPAVRSCCTSVLNSGMQWMTRRIFTELFASDPSQPELAPLQNYLRCRCFFSMARAPASRPSTPACSGRCDVSVSTFENDSQSLPFAGTERAGAISVLVDGRSNFSRAHLGFCRTPPPSRNGAERLL